MRYTCTHTHTHTKIRSIIYLYTTFESASCHNNFSKLFRFSWFHLFLPYLLLFVGMLVCFVCMIFYEIHIIYIWFKAHYPKIYEFTICLIDAKLKLASKTFRWEMKYRCYTSLVRSTLSLSRYISLSFIGCGRVFVNYLVSRLRYSQLFSR